jgi:soluble lytic murein transglycosylase
MIHKFDGNWVYALGAYNAGPTRMGRWRKEAQPQWDMIEFIESISYQETREYVAAIVRNYYWYSYQLHQKRPENFSMFWQTNKPQAGGS